MRRDDIVDLLQRIPEADLTKVQFILRTGLAISLDTLIRHEPHYMVIRGREAGNQDEGRGFFLPYDDIVFMKIERVVQLAELDNMFRDRPDTLASRAASAKAVPPNETQSDATAVTPKPTVPMDPAAIAKANLLERIRAAKSINTPKASGSA